MDWYRNMRTAHKLLLGFGIVTALLAFVGWTGVTSMSRMESNVTTIYQRDFAGLNAAEEAKLNQAFAARSVRSALLAANKAEAAKHLDDVRRYATELRAAVGKAQAVLTTPASKAELERTQELMEAWVKRNDRLIELVSAGNTQQAMSVMAAANAATLELSASLAKVCELTHNSIDNTYRNSMQTFETGRREVLLTAILSVILAIALGYSATRAISVPLAKAVTILNEVAQGNFTGHLDSNGKDETGQMGSALNLAVRSIRAFVESVSTSAKDMAGASRETSRRAPKGPPAYRMLLVCLIRCGGRLQLDVLMRT